MTRRTGSFRSLSLRTPEMPGMLPSFDQRRRSVLRCRSRACWIGNLGDDDAVAVALRSSIVRPGADDDRAAAGVVAAARCPRGRR